LELILKGRGFAACGNNCGEGSSLHLILSGAAVYDCDNCIVSNAVLQAAVLQIAVLQAAEKLELHIRVSL
jgi:hypothetical protein